VYIVTPLPLILSTQNVYACLSPDGLFIQSVMHNIGAAFFASDAPHYLRICKQSLGSLDLVVNIERVTIHISISIMVTVALWIRCNDQ
jgi:hypothetical protein